MSPRDLVATQAEDDGLWFVAQTAPEAYLQSALRNLHAAVEEDGSLAGLIADLRMELALARDQAANSTNIANCSPEVAAEIVKQSAEARVKRLTAALERAS